MTAKPTMTVEQGEAMSDARCCEVCESCARICDGISANSGGGWETFGQAIRSSCTHAGTRQVLDDHVAVHHSDLQAVAWALKKLGAFGVLNNTQENAFMADRLQAMISAAPQSGAVPDERQSQTDGDGLVESLNREAEGKEIWGQYVSAPASLLRRAAAEIERLRAALRSEQGKDRK